MTAKPIKIKPKDCVPDQEIEDNIIRNFQLIQEWDGPCKVNSKEAWVMSAGPSLKFATQTMFTKEYFEKLPRDSYEIFCIKHSLPILRDAGIVPFGCVALDPRPISGTSTHGFVRTSLYDAAPKETLMFIASMTHPSVTEHLLEKGYRIIGWHASSSQIDNLVSQGKIPAVLAHSGGTCSAMRCISMSHSMGFRRANMVGFDSSVSGVPEDKDAELPNTIEGEKSKKYLELINPKDKDSIPFWSTGELVAQAQDLEKALLNEHMLDMELRFYGTDKGRSYGGNIVDSTPNNTIRPTYEERYAQ